VAFSPNSCHVASGSLMTTAYNYASSEMLSTLKGHKEFVRSMAFSPNSDHLVSGAGDMSVRLWDVASSEMLTTYGGHTGSATVRAGAFSPNGNRIASGSDDSTMRVWDTECGDMCLKLDIGSGMWYSHQLAIVLPLPWRKRCEFGM
jgi:WD40 repeat protein